MDLHAIQQYAEGSPRFHHHAPTPEQAELTTGQERHQLSCLAEAEQGVAPSPCSRGQYCLITILAIGMQPVICSAVQIETHGSVLHLQTWYATYVHSHCKIIGRWLLCITHVQNAT